MDTATETRIHREPWNKGKLVGQKAPFKHGAGCPRRVLRKGASSPRMGALRCITDAHAVSVIGS